MPPFNYILQIKDLYLKDVQVSTAMKGKTKLRLSEELIFQFNNIDSVKIRFMTHSISPYLQI